MAIEAFLLAEGNRLGDRLHANSQQGICDKLHRSPRAAAAAQIKILTADRAEDRLSGLKEFLVSATEERQGALFSGGRAAGNRRVQECHASLMTQFVELARSCRQHRAHLDYC